MLNEGWQRDLHAALSICAAVVGAGFASGREVAAFFSSLGWPSWLGIAAACSGIGALVALIMREARRTQSDSVPALYRALLGDRCGDAVEVLYALLLVMTAAAMVAGGGELGALALPLKGARLYGVGITIALALILAVYRLKWLGVLGALLAVLAIGYYGCMAVQSGGGTPVPSAGVLMAVPMGLFYAAFNVSIAGGTACLCAPGVHSPVRSGWMTALIMAAMLAAANAALLGNGLEVCSMTMPAVALAARWGTAGYYLSIIVMWTAILTTLCAVLSSLRAQWDAHGKHGKLVAVVACALAVLLSVCGFETIVNLVYPLLGWVCAVVLVALPIASAARSPKEG